MGTRRWLTVMIGAGLALAACSGGASTSQHKTAQSQAQSGSNPCLPGSCGANVGGTGTTLSGTSTTTSAKPSNAASSNALRAWAAGHLAGLQAIDSQAGHLLAGGGDATQLKLACSQLGSSVQAAMSGPPPPDAAIAGQLQGGLTQLAQLARDCTAAFNGGGPTAASRLVYEAQQGTAAIDGVIHTLNAAVHAA